MGLETESTMPANYSDARKLLQELQENPEKIFSPELSVENLVEIKKLIHPFAYALGPPRNPEKKRVVACSYHNLREAYLKRFLMTSIVGFVFKMLEEWEVPEKVRNIEEIVGHGVSATLLPQEFAKKIVRIFLQNIFEFDPNVHTKSNQEKNRELKDVSTVGTDEKETAKKIESLRKMAEKDTPVLVDPIDPERIPLFLLKHSLPDVLPEHEDAVRAIWELDPYNAVSAILRNPRLLQATVTAVRSPEIFRRYLSAVPPSDPTRAALYHLPPYDTFHRWTSYIEANYERFRTITDTLYPEKSDLDWAIGLWEYFEGSDRDVDEKFSNFCKRNEDHMITSVHGVEFGAWTLLGDYKENLERIKFYNRRNGVLHRIMEQLEADQKLGEEMMRHRVKINKADNIAREGPDHPGLKKYRSVQDATNNKLERAISDDEMRLLEKAKGNLALAKELESLYKKQEKISELQSRVQNGSYSDELCRELERAKAEYEQMKQMVAVPDDAVQVDVFTIDKEKGCKKSHFYTTMPVLTSESGENAADN